MNASEMSQAHKKKNIIKSMHTFLKNHKRLTIAIVAALAAIIVCIVIVMILHSAQAKEMTQAQIGRCYIASSGSTTEIHYFQENGCSYLFVGYEDETRQKVTYVGGSLSEIYCEYSFEISLFGTVHLDYLSYGLPVVFGENYQIVSHRTGEWKLISLEEALAFEEESNRLYALTMCEHSFGPAEVVKTASCSNSGEMKQVCNICGYEQIVKTDKLPHDYVNKICSVCGAKKPVEKSDIEANTWYTYQDVLHFQNIKLQSAFSVSNGKGMMVSYCFVCQHCHVVDETLRTNVPEFNYAIKKMFTCDECGGITTVKIELE